MNQNAYIRHQSESKNIEIVFHYVNSNTGVNRVFNFQRNIDEKIQTALARIRINVEKEFDKQSGGSKKKSKKRSAASSNETKSDDNEVDLLIEKDESTTWKDLLTNASNNCFEGAVLKIFDQQYNVTFNYPYVSQITMPTVILVGYDCHPTRFEVIFAERAECLFEWYRGLPSENKNDDDIEWIKCEDGNGFFYNVQSSDFQHKLKLICIPKKDEKIGPQVQVISKCTVESGPGYYAFEEKQLFTPNRLKGNQFRVISYNLLADYYCDSEFSRTELFPYCPPFALAIDYRKLLFIREILGYHADICCLQEVDAKIFDLDLTTSLGNDGFDGLLQKKGETAEGVATFYHRDKFSLFRSYGINLSEHMTEQSYFKELYEKIKSNVKVCERMLSLSTALQVTVLKSKTNDQYLVVANTHLYFHPDADHIRLLQIGFFMLYVEYIYNNTMTELNIGESQISVIFCGDFNSVPECGIYKLMTEKLVPHDFIDFGSNKEEAVTGVTLKQLFDIRSAYNNPKYTNFTVGFADCLDYIFYQTRNLTLLQAIPLPSEEELRSMTAIPSIVFPSDHVSLVADFEWKQ